MDDLVTKAYNDFMTRLFGEVPKEPREHEVTREQYTQTMQDVQKFYGITQGHPGFLEFMLTMVGRSPKIIEGAGNDERERATEGNSRTEQSTEDRPSDPTEEKAVGEITPRKTKRE
jgi:hypothetical protein